MSSPPARVIPLLVYRPGGAAARLAVGLCGLVKPQVLGRIARDG
jgi:hypothetical protein